MKKLLFATNILLLGIIVMQGCDSSGTGNAPPPVNATAASCPVYKDYSKDKFEGIKALTAFEMASLYKKNHQSRYSVNGEEDALTAWLSLDTLRKFLWYIDKMLCENKCTKINDMGIRFYFAEYPLDLQDASRANDDYTTVKDEYGGRHTLFLVPTFHNISDSIDYDFDAIGTNWADCNFTKMKSPDLYREWNAVEKARKVDKGFNKIPNSLLEKMMILSVGINGKALNHMGMIPPGKATGTAFIEEEAAAGN